MDAQRSSEPLDGVRLPGEVLETTRPWSVPDKHATLRRSRIRFDSWRGRFRLRFRFVYEWRRTAAKINPSFAAGALTLEPDGRAAACKAVEVGSIPTGVSDQPTAGSDYITTQRCLNHSLVGRPQHRLNCLLRAHDGPKVAIPGDRLVNGAGVCCRRWGQSTISG